MASMSSSGEGRLTGCMTREPNPRTRRAAERDGLLDPAGTERAQDVPVGHDRHVPVDGEDLLDHAVAARRHLVGRLAVGHAVAPQVPVGALLADRRRRDALVVAVVPLEQVLADLGRVAEAGQPGRLARAVERAREHLGERVGAERAGELAGAVAPGLGQRHVGAPGVAPGPRPLGLRVADEPHLLVGVRDHPLSRPAPRRRR
jgi:hypothetical protein